MRLPRTVVEPQESAVASPRSAVVALLPHALAVLQVATLLTMGGVVASKVWQDQAWVGFAVVGVTAAVWAPELSRPRARRWWFAYVAGIFVYTLLRAYADETLIPIRTGYVITLDRDLFLGRDPVVWLQDRLFSPTSISPLDWAAVSVHWSFFFAPHLGAIAVFLWRRDLFPRYTVLVVGTMYLGLVLFYLLPTTPPWLAAQQNALPQVYRVMDFVGGRVDAETYRTFYASLGEPNSVAAMPSIHMAVTFAMYLWTRDHYPRFAPILLVYSLVMGLALVYLAEHYILDLLAGVACALVCHVASRRIIRVPTRY